MKQLVANVFSLRWVHFALPIQFVLTLAFVLTFFFDSQYFGLKNGPPVFQKKVLVFQKTLFKVNILKTFKIPSDCHIKTCLSLKRRAILKIPSIDFQRSTRSSYWLQNKTSARKRFSVLRQKPLTFCRKTCVLQKSIHPFSVYQMRHLV